MKANAIIQLSLPSELHLKTIVEALKPEVNRQASNRAKVTLQEDGTFLTLNFESGSTTVLRSALNAYLRWIDSLINVIIALE